jgi:cysteinyl-tRNA synthetase
MKKKLLIDEKQYKSVMNSFENLYMDCDYILNVTDSPDKTFEEAEEEFSEIKEEWETAYYQLQDTVEKLGKFHEKYTGKKVRTE